MKSKFLLIITIVILSFPKVYFGQAPNLGTAANFVLFTTVGGVSNVGITHLTGNVGTNSGLSTGFGNVDGQMHDNDGVSAQCAADLLIAYNQLNATIPTFFPAPLLGNGQTLVAGVYSIATPATLNLDLTLDGLGDPNAVFIFQIQGSFSTNASAKVKLINGAQACNVFWKVEGLVDMSVGTTMRGTIIANNAAINMTAGDTLEGRALSTTGAITVSGILGYKPNGCGSLVLTGPTAPVLASVDCYALFSSNGPVTNVGVTNVTGDIGTNNGSVTGFNPLNVVGVIHGVPDGSTAACATDLNNVFLYLNTLPFDIELLYPAQFGNNLVLTPHTYLMNSAASFTDSLYLNAEGNANAVFVIRINGALSTSVNSRVILLNGAQSKNVYWLVNGAVTINDNSIFRGTIICNNGAVSLNTGVMLDGRVLTTTGALNTAAVTVIFPLGSCGTSVPPSITSQPANQVVCEGNSAIFSVSASGTALTFQWRKGLVNLVNGGNISGATTATLTINPASSADAAANYNVVVSGSATPTVSSVNASLVVNTAPLIVSEPSDQITCLGNVVTFTVSATGTALTYQWRKGLVNLLNGGNISGATTASLTINPVSITDVALNYNVVISGTCLPNATSIDAALSISTSPTITSEPSNQTVCLGNSVTFTVAAIGGNLSYQWRKGLVNLINGGSISGATTASLTINPTSLSDAALDYNVVVSGACLPNDISNNASLAFNTSPIANASSNSPVCSGSSINLSSALVAGGTYSWTSSTGFTSSLQNPIIVSSSTLDAGTYSLTVSDGTCTSSVSSVLVVVNDCDFDLSVVKTVNVVNPVVGNTVVFTIAATNNGSLNATGVIVIDLLESGYSYVSSTTTVGSYDALTGVWTIGNLNSGVTEVLTITATVLSSGNYVNTAIISGNDAEANMANNSSSVETFPSDFNIPEGFSPNGDGINDLFVIRGIQNFPSNNFTIFNRWGDKVFEASPYKNTWDGSNSKGLTIGGNALPTGTYFYVIDLGDGSKVIKGTIYLNR
ncbi:MAG: hypothetical protein C0448_02160 [Sphingobacteriaceae bacterium]|nr:hypothetical protein [Sphingobacteriaceae bacterium]